MTLLARTLIRLGGFLASLVALGVMSEETLSNTYGEPALLLLVAAFAAIALTEP
jgi:hypothetical protein